MAVIAYHLVWTAYGTWLPNDPRGSGSRDVRSHDLAELGVSHLGRKKRQPPRSEVLAFYDEAEPRLQFPIIRLDAGARSLVAEGFAEAIAHERYTCYACALLRDHVHLVIRKHRHRAEQMIEALQTRSADRLRFSPAVPPDHPIWTDGGWKVFLDAPETVRTRIRYVERNPAKDGLATQTWPFVVPYDNWPFHKKRR